MLNIIDNDGAALDTLNGSCVVILGEGMKPVLEDIRCFARQSPSPEYRQVEQFNRVSSNRAFFIAAVLHTIAMSLNRLHGIKDRLKRLPEQIPHGGKLSDHTRFARLK